MRFRTTNPLACANARMRLYVPCACMVPRIYYSTAGAECFYEFGVRGDKGAVDQVNAVRDGGHDGVQALVDRFGFAGQVDDQAVSTDAGGLAGQDCRWHVLQGDLTH